MIGNVQPGVQEVSADAVAEDSRFAGNGVVLNRLEPQLLRVLVDVLEERDARVALPPNVTNVDNAVFTPTTVKVTAPRTVLKNAPENLVVYVDPAALQQLKPGTTGAQRLPLTLPFQDRNTRLSVGAVDATFDVKQKDVETTLQSIPVWVTYAPGVEEKYKVQYDPTTPTVHVVGPADKIKAITDNTFRPKATFEVSEEKINPGTDKQHAELKYDLPEGVKVKLEDAKRPVEYTLIPRTE